jgi:hypothetical protein
MQPWYGSLGSYWSCLMLHQGAPREDPWETRFLLAYLVRLVLDTYTDRTFKYR